MKKKTKIGAVLCCSTALVAILGGYLLTNNTGLFNSNKQIINKENNQDSGLQISQEVENMTVALLNKNENQDGSISYTYTFTITPDNATRKDISGNLFFVDNTEGIENFLEFSINQQDSTFTITKKADFSHKARLVLSCNADPSVKATINLDCKQYFKGFNDVSEKTYHKLLDSEHNMALNEIKNDGASSINADNFSTIYTVATRTKWRIEETVPTVTGYLTGDNIEEMTDSGLTITDSWAIKQANFDGDFSLTDLQDMVYEDSALMPGTEALSFSQKAYFGVAYDLNFTYSVANVLKKYTAHMVVVASTADLDFGVPTGLNVESKSISFENVVTAYRFIFTDSSNNVTYIDSQAATGTGWVSTGSRPFYNGYINIEITRSRDGEIITPATVLYTINDGKGYFTGSDFSNFYIVYNPGGYENVNWVCQKTKFNDNLYGVTNLASSIL